jgi:Family of unknown function (DUF6088)
MESAQTKVNRSLSAINAGRILSPTDFRGSGSQAAIKMALSRAVRDGKARRLAHGIYFVPFVDPLLGELIPSAEGVAAQLAEKEKVRIRPTGAFALHKLGLTTQVPTKLVYLTDGHPRKFKIGKAEVEFKATTPKKMALEGKISGPLILALEELKLDKLDPATEKKVITLLQLEEPGTLEQDLKLATGKVYDYLTRLTKQLNRVI